MRIRYCNLKCIKHLKLEKTQVDSCVFTEIEDVRFVLPMCASHTPATTISSYQQCGAWVLEISLMRPSFFSIFNNLGNKVPWLYKPYNHCPGPAYLAESAPKQRWQWKPDVHVESKTSCKQRLSMRLPLMNEMRLPLMIATDDWRKTKLKIKEQYRCKCQSTDWLGATQDCQQAAESFEPILLDTKWLTLSHKFKKLWIDLLKKKYMNCHI